MSEITSAGYENIRDYIEGLSPNAWTHVQLYTGADAPVLSAPRVIAAEGATETNCQWQAREDTGQTLVVKIVVTGTDEDITKPVTIEKGAILDASDGDEMTPKKVLSSSATIAENDDVVSIYLKVQVPEIV